MKFKEMSCDELKKDFEKILNSFSDEELFESLKKYIINDIYEKRGRNP